MLKFRTINLVFYATLILLLVYTWIETLPLLGFCLFLILYLIVLVCGSFVLSMQFFLPVKFKGGAHSNSIAITFDDGPVPGRTEKILEILKSGNVPAAFFCIGSRVAHFPALAKRIHDAGHLLGNHSYWHGKMFDLQSAEKIERELADTDEVIQRTIGKRPNFFRPPYGVTNPMVAKAVRNGGHKTIGWTIRSFDTVITSPAALMNRVTKSLKAGDVIVFHDDSSITLAILPAVLDRVAKLGLKIVRVDELLNEKGYG